MHESEVYERYPKLFAHRELMEARRTGQIRWFDLRKGPHYSVEQLKEYLKSRERPLCKNNVLFAEEEQEDDNPAPARSNGSGNIKGIGSDMRKGPMPSTITGTTNKLVELAANRLEQET